MVVEIDITQKGDVVFYISTIGIPKKRLYYNVDAVIYWIPSPRSVRQDAFRQTIEVHVAGKPSRSGREIKARINARLACRRPNGPGSFEASLDVQQVLAGAAKRANVGRAQRFTQLFAAGDGAGLRIERRGQRAHNWAALFG